MYLFKLKNLLYVQKDISHIVQLLEGMKKDKRKLGTIFE